jgi:Spy/CpxP family protein refolding chaperone
MNSRRILAGAILAAAAIAIVPVRSLMADTAGTETARLGPAGHGPWGPERVFEKLGLTPAQEQSVQGILAAQRPALKNLHEQIRANLQKLHQLSPDDPNYAATATQVSQATGALTTQAIAAGSDLRAQLFAVLDPGQKAKLLAMEAKMRARFEGHARHWRDRGPPPPGP